MSQLFINQFLSPKDEEIFLDRKRKSELSLVRLWNRKGRDCSNHSGFIVASVLSRVILDKKILNQVMIIVLVLLFIGSVTANEEIVPHAHGFRKPDSNIRRAPVIPTEERAFSSVPHAKGLVRASTGVRRAPNTHSVPLQMVKPTVRVARRPLSPRPLGLVPMPVMRPIELPTVSLSNLPTLPTLAPMPTLPSFTMPPSFQRLLGITTTAAPVHSKPRFEYKSEENNSERLIEPKEHRRELSSVRSRLPKFVSKTEDELVSPEKNAAWISSF